MVGKIYLRRGISQENSRFPAAKIKLGRFPNRAVIISPCLEPSQMTDDEQAGTFIMTKLSGIIGNSPKIVPTGLFPTQHSMSIPLAFQI